MNISPNISECRLDSKSNLGGMDIVNNNLLVIIKNTREGKVPSSSQILLDW